MGFDFITIKQQLPGIVRVMSDFYQTPHRKGSVYFVRSPATNDRTASLALYPGSDRFCDFANGNLSGDCIAFVSYVRGCNNWEALQILKDFYGLADSQQQDGRKYGDAYCYSSRRNAGEKNVNEPFIRRYGRK